ncbi:MAG: hypothetical protein A2X70_00560 [Alphaproteobacteria bacterium GWC2_42_16]|nr:MAG: hypothetical protein A2X70_00560 [Alphaproteobacteria bacterium GWC2_42_16]OFW73815.1 MAG: hypothetical protein A2Z80_05810 [Alphaproteobacteria bacterium GWA2_41_27]OFW82097.1 MAG: hypothetical protein A3E50_06620 [Alphaproteobacteria bacterium RIFCSPHIGHO2_12_FULL_42_100]OFW86326.1 MAG: hypothetical protein A2W06_03230 [Alphaproteobacteria bacterium RBG_16_42_14]OFW91238.1 MAG: hypothetical protein A3C41_06260 [Alphaproteobacteria bacterium RIFCSPHIGHO2_02_FULL_42_30]OFW93123.1 MAG: 
MCLRFSGQEKSLFFYEKQAFSSPRMIELRCHPWKEMLCPRLSYEQKVIPYYKGGGSSISCPRIYQKNHNFAIPS